MRLQYKIASISAIAFLLLFGGLSTAQSTNPKQAQLNANTTVVCSSNGWVQLVVQEVWFCKNSTNSEIWENYIYINDTGAMKIAVFYVPLLQYEGSVNATNGTKSTICTGFINDTDNCINIKVKEVNEYHWLYEKFEGYQITT
jgi:hypothetical protein